RSQIHAGRRLRWRCMMSSAMATRTGSAPPPMTRLAVLLGRSAAAGADGGDRRYRVPARPRPQGRHGVDGRGYRVGGPFVVDPPSDEVRPCLGRVALDAEADRTHPVDRLQELGVGQADPGLRVSLFGN